MALSIVDSPWEHAALTQRLQRALSGGPPDPRALAARLLLRFGPASQNRELRPDFRGHLQGRVSHAAFLNPRRGAKLQDLLGRILRD